MDRLRQVGRQLAERLGRFSYYRRQPTVVLQPPLRPELTGFIAVRELLLVWKTFWHRHWLTVVLGTIDLLLVAVMLVFLIFEAILWAWRRYGAPCIGAAVRVLGQLQEETKEEVLDDVDVVIPELEDELDAPLVEDEIDEHLVEGEIDEQLVEREIDEHLVEDEIDEHLVEDEIDEHIVEDEIDEHIVEDEIDELLVEERNTDVYKQEDVNAQEDKKWKARIKLMEDLKFTEDASLQGIFLTLEMQEKETDGIQHEVAAEIIGQEILHDDMQEEIEEGEDVLDTLVYMVTMQPMNHLMAELRSEGRDGTDQAVPEDTSDASNGESHLPIEDRADDCPDIDIQDAPVEPSVVTAPPEMPAVQHYADTIAIMELKEIVEMQEVAKMNHVAIVKGEVDVLDYVEVQQIVNVQDCFISKDSTKLMEDWKMTGNVTRDEGVDHSLQHEASATMEKEAQDQDAPKQDGDVSETAREDITSVSHDKEKLPKEVEAAPDLSAIIEDGEPEIVKVKGARLLVKRMIDDGNSLFGSVAFLMYKTKPGWPEHKKHVSLLRRSAVRYLMGKIDDYWEDLLEGLSHHVARYADLGTEDEKVDQYLKDMMEPGFHVGTAVVYAIADYYGIDVVVFVGRLGSIRIDSQHSKVTQELAVLRTQSTNRYGEVVYHFDSVMEIMPTEETIQ